MFSCFVYSSTYISNSIIENLISVCCMIQFHIEITISRIVFQKRNINNPIVPKDSFYMVIIPPMVYIFEIGNRQKS